MGRIFCDDTLRVGECVSRQMKLNPVFLLVDSVLFVVPLKTCHERNPTCNPQVVNINIWLVACMPQRHGSWLPRFAAYHGPTGSAASVHEFSQRRLLSPLQVEHDLVQVVVTLLGQCFPVLPDLFYNLVMAHSHPPRAEVPAECRFRDRRIRPARRWIGSWVWCLRC